LVGLLDGRETPAIALLRDRLEIRGTEFWQWQGGPEGQDWVGVTDPFRQRPKRHSLFTEKYLAQPAHLEQTIEGPLEFTGVGLHSGAPVTMRLLPAPGGSGIVFRRTDLDNFEIPATGRNVAKVSYATSLMRQGVLISTTEHLLSACIGTGIDNVIVELDNLELPILDGSAQPYVEAILDVGIRVQRRKRETIKVLKPVEVREGNKFIGVYPGSGYRISYEIDFPSPIGKLKTCIDLAAEMYGQEIAPARTFGYKADEQKLRDMGLIRGANSDNAIILGANGPENGPLRFEDEYVRHKVLDLIGDLALAGKRIEGHVVAERAGHAMHTAFVARLLKDRSAWELAHIPANETASEARSEEALGTPVLAGA
jgi:UDP-3-O-[3-hydroxymyristoyl] N-acetylglucosamine deacetylase